MNCFFSKSLLLLSIFSTLFFSSSLGQISFNIENAQNKRFYLHQIKGERHFMLDSVTVQKGILSFEWKSEYTPGMYQISDGQNGCVFLAKDTEIKLKSTWPSLQDSLVVNSSPENELWLHYLSFRNKTNMKLELLSPVLSYYPQETAFYRIAKNEFASVQDSLHKWVNNISNKESYTLATHFIQADIKPKVPVDLYIGEQKEFFKAHYFDNIDWNDTLLMYSNVLTSKITEYLGLHANPNMSKAELEQAFSYAIDQFLPKSMVNDQMYAFCLDYLVRGFERFNFEEVILHIAQTYPPPIEQCENEVRKSAALARLEKYESMQIGQTAPDFELPNLQGEMVKLSDCKKEKILLVFWASWCPHCKEIITQINTWYSAEKQKTWQVYTISIDTSKEDLQTYLKSKNINLPVLCNYKGWDTRAAVDYNIYATPTMIVLDNELRILSKPMRVGELR